MTITKFSTILIAASICVAVGSCSDDKDNPESPVQENATQKVNPNTVFPEGVPSQVGDYVITKNSDGLVTKIVNDDEVTIFNYTPSTGTRANGIPANYDMIMNVEWGGDADGVDLYIRLNSMGYIEYAFEVDEDEDFGVSYEEWWFKYNSAGQLIEMKRTEGDNEVTTITYNADGDIYTVSVKDDEGDSDMETIVYYTNQTHMAPIVNLSGIMLYDNSFRIDMDEMAPAYYAGLLGKGTKHLPLSAIEKNIRPNREDDTDYYTFEWEFNSRNMPVKFTNTITTQWGTYTEDPIIFKW